MGWHRGHLVVITADRGRDCWESNSKMMGDEMHSIQVCMTMWRQCAIAVPTRGCSPSQSGRSWQEHMTFTSRFVFAQGVRPPS
eukprot:scaffold9903_cov30-Tisochrysis_lutea.AAC.11